jgi:hypothetical protein
MNCIPVRTQVNRFIAAIRNYESKNRIKQKIKHYGNIRGFSKLKKPATTNASPRRSIAHVSILGTTQLHLRNPWVIAFWSFMFPGLGHMLLSKYFRGFLLIAWEILINIEAHVNLGLLYSFIGQFGKAKEVLDIRWVFLYIPTYFFAVWDSYRTSVDINKNFVLAAREDAEIKPFVINSLEINYLDKSSPWVAFVWSMMTPGAGQIIIHRIVDALCILITWIGIVYFSRLLPSILYTMLGRLEDAKAVLNPQWFLNVPSIYFFAMYDAYINTVESNKLFEWEQSKFLKRDYQDKSFPVPLKEHGKVDSMYIVLTFEHSINLESAITAIQTKGVAKEDILAVPLDKRGEQGKLFDTMHSSDGLSMMDLPMILASFLCLMGAIYGFILPMGPVLFGLIGMGCGFLIGFAIKLLTTKKSNNRQKNNKASEVVVLIACRENQTDMVQETLWANSALGVSKLSLGDDQ